MLNREVISLNIIALALYLPFIFFGYGTCCDSYGVLETGRRLLEEGSYIPSRYPGYLVHELATLILSLIGGSILSNLGTLTMAMATFNSLIYICGHYRLPNSRYIVLLVIIHPLFWSDSTSTIDYVWAIGFIFAGFAVLLRNRFVLGGLLMGLAVGSRLGSVFAVGGILVFFWITERDHKRHLAGTALISGLLGMLCYLPSFAAANWTSSFLLQEWVGRSSGL